MKPIYTFNSLLKELKEEITTIKEEQIYETLKPFYASSKDRHIIIDGKKITKPLAVSKKNKNTFKRENSPLVEFYDDTKKGDFLKVISIENGIAKCINLSLKEEIKDKYYKEEFIYLTIENIILGDVKLAQRGVSKYVNSKDKEKENIGGNK